MKSEFEQEIENILSDDIKNGNVVILESQQFFNKIQEIFPIDFNRINWGKHGYKIYSDLSKQTTLEKKRISILKFLKEVEYIYPEIINNKLIIIGDSLLEHAYCMNYIFFKEYFFSFFSIPEHTYVLINNENKCINYTFEDEIFFG